MNKDERLDQLKELINELNKAIICNKQEVAHIYIGYDNNDKPTCTMDYHRKKEE